MARSTPLGLPSTSTMWTAPFPTSVPSQSATATTGLAPNSPLPNSPLPNSPLPSDPVCQSNPSHQRAQPRHQGVCDLRHSGIGHCIGVCLKSQPPPLPNPPCCCFLTAFADTLVTSNLVLGADPYRTIDGGLSSPERLQVRMT